MRARLSVIFLALTLGWSALARSQEKPVQQLLTLPDSLDRAYKSNPRLLQAERDLSLARLHSKEARALFYPKVNLDLNYVRYRNETLGLTPPELGSVLLEAPIETRTGDRANPLAANLYYGRIGFIQTLFAGGRLNYTYKLSQANIKQSESDYESLQRQIGFETTRSFGQLLAIRAKKGLVEARLKEFTSSKHPSAEAVRSRSELRQRLADLEEKEHDAKYDFLQSIGVELFSEVDVSGTLDTPPIDVDLKTALVWAKQNRSDWRQTQLQAEVDQLSVNLALAERYPVFMLGGGVELRDSNFPINETNWNTALSMNIPLFDGISIPTRIKESRQRAERGRLHRVQLEDQIEREVRGAFDDVNHWDQELKDRLKDSADLTQAISSSASPSSAMWKLDSDLGLIDARYELFLAKARLLQVTGQPISHP